MNGGDKMPENVQPKENIIGTEKIGKLLLKFSIPGVISMLVNSIYNIVDQIFIGQGVGYLGNAATNIVYLFVILQLGIALLISAGSVANMSLNLGRKRRDIAEKVIGNAVSLAIVCGILILLVGEIFNTPILRFFGSTDTVLPYAIDYSRIYLLGIPFTTVSIVLNDMIRADGAPGYSMFCMLCGAIANTILDPIFIFVFKWGVQGAAFATILGQILTFVLCLIRLPRLKTVTFHKKNLLFDLEICKMIVTLGFSACINQITMMLVQIVLNKTIVKYGAQSIYGADIPLTCFGIVMKVNQIVMSIVLGICSSTQPLFGYNFGAKYYKRVLKIFKYACIAVSTIGILGCALIQIFPEYIVALFGQENDLYNEFAVNAFHIMTLFMFVMGFQILTSMYFQAVGKPKYAIILSLSRQFLFLLPCILILPLFFGLNGILLSYPTSDIISIMLALILFSIEYRKLKHLIKTEDCTPEGVSY